MGLLHMCAWPPFYPYIPLTAHLPFHLSTPHTIFQYLPCTPSLPPLHGPQDLLQNPPSIVLPVGLSLFSYPLKLSHSPPLTFSITTTSIHTYFILSLSSNHPLRLTRFLFPPIISLASHADAVYTYVRFPSILSTHSHDICSIPSINQKPNTPHTPSNFSSVALNKKKTVIWITHQIQLNFDPLAQLVSHPILLTKTFQPLNLTTPNPPNRLRSYLLHLMSSSAPIFFIWNLN